MTHPTDISPSTSSYAVPYPPARQAWIAILILFVLYVVSLLDRNIITLFADDIRREFGISDLELSLLFGPAFALSYAIGALPFGWAMDRFSRRKVLWAGVTIWSLGTVACGLSRGFAQIFIARGLVGAGEAALVPASQSIIADQFPPDRLAFPISIYSLGARFGQGSSLLLGGLLAAIVAPSALFVLPVLGEMRGWRLIFLMVGLPGIFLAMLIFLTPEPVRRASGAFSRKDATFRAYLSHAFAHRRFFLGLHVGAILAIIVVTALAVWSPAFYQRRHNWPVDQVGRWLGVALIVGPVIGTPLHGFLADRLFRWNVRDGHMRYMAFAVLIATLPLIACYIVSSPWVSLVCLSIGEGLLVSTTVLMATTLQLMVPSEMRGKAASVLLLITGVGAVSVGPAIAALISENLLGGPMMIGIALAIMVGVGLPLAASSFAIAMRPLATAYAKVV